MRNCPKSLIFVLCCLFLWAGTDNAAAQDAKEQREYAGSAFGSLEKAYSALDAGRIPSGILHDRVISFSPVEELHGNRDSGPATAGSWRQAAYEMYRASVRTSDLPGPQRIRERITAIKRKNRIPLGLIHVSYNSVRKDALVSGRLIRDGHRIIDGVYDGNSPYDSRLLSSVSALLESVYQNAEFIADDGLFISNFKKRPDALEIDFGDGYRRLVWNQPLPVFFSRTGKQEIKARYKIDGITFHAFFEIDVKPMLPVSAQPDIAWEDQLSSYAYDSEYATYDAHIFLGDGNTFLDKPAILVEGFDIENNMNWPELFDLINIENLADELLADGYDLVIMNFGDATRLLQQNALAVATLIERVEQASEGKFPTIIAGASMGGLLTRYALTWMEHQQILHNVKLFVSFDAPQQGASIPLGVQHWIWFFAPYNDRAEEFIWVLNRPGARQLLYNHRNSFPNVETIRTGFQAELDGLGGYPSNPKLRMVAVANGSGLGAAARQLGKNNDRMGFGSQIINWKFRHFLVDVDGDVWSVPNGGSSLLRIFEGKVDILGPFNDEIDVRVSGTTAYDCAPGGFRETQQQIADVQPRLTVLGQRISLGNIKTDFPNHAFVPTASALDARDANGEPLDIFHDIAADPDIVSRSPFDTLVYAQSENEKHVLVTPGNKSFLKDEFARVIRGVKLVDETFDRPLTDLTDQNPESAAKPPGANEHTPGYEPLTGTGRPRQLLLHANYPNPFNPVTHIRYELPRRQSVRIAVYSLLGKRIRVLFEGIKSAGSHKIVWDGRLQSGSPAASGVYIYRLESDEQVRHGRMLLLK